MRKYQGEDTFYERLAAKQQWDEVANRYETERRLELIFNRLLVREKIEGRRFLDVGSGGGHFSAAAVERGAEVWSLDIGENLLRQVASRCKTKSRCVVGRVEHLPFGNETFEIVLCTEVIEHTKFPIHVVGELCRVVAPGGILAVTTPCRLWQPVVRIATRLGFRPYRGYENFIWPWELLKSVQAQGMEVERLLGFNCLPFFWRLLDPIFTACDRLFGDVFPFLAVNIAIFARRVGSTEAEVIES